MRTVTILTHSYLNGYAEGEQFTRPFGGGLERYMYELCAVIQAKGWQSVVHQLSYYRTFDTVYEGTRVRGYPYELNDIAGAFNRMAEDAEGLIIYASCIWHPIAYKPGSIGICHGINWDWPEFGDKVKSGVAYMIQLAVDGLDRLVSVDSHFLTYCRSVCTFDDPEKLVLLPNAVDTEWFIREDSGGRGVHAIGSDADGAVLADSGGQVPVVEDGRVGGSDVADAAVADSDGQVPAEEDRRGDGAGIDDTAFVDNRLAPPVGEWRLNRPGVDDSLFADSDGMTPSVEDGRLNGPGVDDLANADSEGSTVVSGFAEVPEKAPLRLLFPRRLSYERGIVPMMLIADLLLAEFPTLTVEFAGELVEHTPVAVAFHEWRQTHSEQARILHHTYAFQAVREAYRAADVVVIPTVYSEGTSLSCLEAMSCGSSVVATNVGGLNDIITDGFNGRLVTPTVNALHAAVKELLTDAPLRARYGEDARRTAMAFDLKRWQRRWGELLEEQFGRIGL